MMTRRKVKQAERKLIESEIPDEYISKALDILVEFVESAEKYRDEQIEELHEEIVELTYDDNPLQYINVNLLDTNTLDGEERLKIAIELAERNSLAELQDFQKQLQP